MPELAEVETVRLSLEKIMKGQKICDVTVDHDDKYFYAFASATSVEKALLGAKVVGTGRRGKYFWLKLNRKPWPIFHLGMTGNISILTGPKKSPGNIWGGVKLWSEKDKGERERLWFARIILTLQNKVEIALLDPRRFGRMWLSDDPEKHSRIAKLGPDPLIDFLSAKDLGSKLKKRGAPIKAVLLDQKLFAGIGNWLADEILYQSRISPRRPAKSLTAKEILLLHDKTILVCKKAVAVKADYELFPKTWIFKHRWGKSKTAKVGGQKIIHEEIGGRTTAWVPGLQK